MKRGQVVWLGTEDAFYAWQGLEDKFFGMVKDAQAFGGREEEDPDEIDINFGVPKGRMGIKLLERVGNTAVVKVHGSLVAKYAWWHDYFLGHVTSYEALGDAMEIAVKAEGVNRILLDIGSGGGMVMGLDNISQRIKWARNYVQVHAHTDSAAFSAAYWIASAAQKVTASPMAEVGSIGTLLITYEMTKAAEQDGIKYHVFRAGEFKALGNPYEELSEKAAQVIQNRLEETNQFFLKHVSTQRNLLMSDRQRWAEGKTFFAEEAKVVGLIDGVLTLDDVIGSGASHNPTSDRRYGDMKISAEKLAQIAAGADPKDVLTAEELKFYQESLAEQEVEEQEGEEQEGEEGAEASEDANYDILGLNKQIGKLEAKLEMADEKLDELKGKLEAKESDMQALLVVAQAALGNLAKALGKPKEIPSSATAVVAKFNELQAEMAQRFKVGRQSAETPTEEGIESQVVSFRSK